MSDIQKVKELSDKLLAVEEQRKKETEAHGKALKTIQDHMEFLRKEKEKESTEKKYATDPIAEEKIDKLNKEVNRLEDELKSACLKIEANRKYNTIDGLAETFTNGESTKSLHQDFRPLAKSILEDPHRKEVYKAFLDMITHPLESEYQSKMTQITNKIRQSDTSSEDSFIKKAITSITGQQAGYLTPPEFDLMINRVLFETSPLRSVATTMTTSRRAYHFPIRTTLPTAVWGSSELKEPEDTEEQKYGLGEIALHELSAKPKISLDQLEDSVINIERQLRTDLSEAFMLAENKAFIKGVGLKEPTGLEKYAKEGDPNVVATTNPLKLKIVDLDRSEYQDTDGSFHLSDALLNLEASILAPYKRNAYYLVSRGVKNLIRQVKDKNNQYLFSNFSGWGGVQGVPAISDGISGRICGYPVLECDDLPSTITVGEYPIYYGNFEKYKIIDRIGLTLILDNVTEKGYMIYYFRKRLGAGLCLAQGITALRVVA